MADPARPMYRTAGDLLGKRVVVQNPIVTGARWVGKAIVYTDTPTYVVETDEGLRVALPASWAVEEPADSQSGDAQ